jgi:hypothetical protein
MQQFIMLIKKLIKEERDATVRAGLCLLLIRIGKLYQQQAISHLTITDLLPALSFYQDPVSYVPILNNLFELFGEQAVIPLVIDLLLTYTRKIDLVFLHTVYESAVILITRNHQLYLTEKIKTLLELQQTFYGKENITELLDQFFIRLGRISYVLSTVEKNPSDDFINVKPPPQQMISRLTLLR